jgi:Na+-transporting NADH:ubiquinone oxidoreductase subunit NqrB
MCLKLKTTQCSTAEKKQKIYTRQIITGYFIVCFICHSNDHTSEKCLKLYKDGFCHYFAIIIIMIIIIIISSYLEGHYLVAKYNIK